MGKIYLAGLTLLLVVAFVVAGQEMEKEQCCPSRLGGLGIGAWSHHKMICASLRHWPSEAGALELNFCAPPGGKRLSVFIKGLNKLSDGCILDLYTAGGFGLPIGGAIDWQRIEGSVGTEWCFPDIPQMTITLEVGASIKHYLEYGTWCWESKTFIAGSVHFHFRAP